MLYFVPIEPFELRYTEDWYNWFAAALVRANIGYKYINGDKLTDKIEQGKFLDICGTNYYKASQIQKISYLIHTGGVQDGDIFLFADGWFPGVESLAYMRDALGIDFKIYGIFHAGTYDMWDFLSQCGMERWGRQLEDSWLKIYDGVFVATEFHKSLITENRNSDPTKIHVTGLPFYTKPEYRFPQHKEKIVVFPHRLDKEKQPEVFDKIADNLQSKFPDWQFIKTMEVDRTKKEYYEILRKSAISVSCALQETWGIAMMESVCMGCIPLVPDRLSYSEMYPPEYWYPEGLESLKVETTINRLENVVINREDSTEAWRIHSDILKLGSSFIEKGEQAIPNMLKIMGLLK